MEKLAATLAMECCHEVVPHGGGGGSCSTCLCSYGFIPMWGFLYGLDISPV
jgi:hypothetical protein